MSLSDSEEYTYASNNRSQSLTTESLLLFNLEQAASQYKSPENDDYSDYLSTVCSANTAATLTDASTPEVISSSSSLASFAEDSEDRKALARLYPGDEISNTSNTSIATLVQKLTSSTSTLNLEPKALQNGSVFETPSMGELQTPPNEEAKVPRKIKSSLKLPGLTRSNSMPATATKTVRFSNTLTKVKTFSEYAKPSSISLDNSPEYSPSEYDGYEQFSSPKAFFDLKNSLISSDDSDDSEEDYFTHRSIIQKTMWVLRCSNFDLLSIQSSSITAPVKLVSLSISNGSNLVGAVEVANVSFEKYVEIKFTNDNWKSIYIVTCSYERSLDSSRDRFKFEINLSNSLLFGNKKSSGSQKSSTFNIGLCVRYVAGGSQTFYDNNDSQNYVFDLISQQRQRKQQRSKHFNNNSSILHRRPTSSMPSFSMNNFSNTETKSSPSQRANNTNSTRYFSEDTDYFNKPSIYNDSSLNSYSFFPKKRPDSESPFSSTFSTTINSATSSASSSSTNISYNTRSIQNRNTFGKSSEYTTKSSPKSAGLTTKNPQSYDEFLNKYCFFKGDNSKAEFSGESLIIK